MLEDAQRPLWTPDPRRVAASGMVAFRDAANTRHGLSLRSYSELHAWSVARRSEFWDLVWDFTEVVGLLEPTSQTVWLFHAFTIRTVQCSRFNVQDGLGIAEKH